MKNFLSKYGRLILVVVGFLILAGLFFWAYKSHTRTVNQIQELQRQNESLKRDNVQKQQAVNSAKEDKKLSVRDTVFQTNIKYVKQKQNEQAKRINNADLTESIELYKEFLSDSTADPDRGRGWSSYEFPPDSSAKPK